MALKTHPKGMEGVYEDNLPRVAGVEVEIRKAKRYESRMGSRSEGRAKEKENIFFLFLKIYEDQLVRSLNINRSPATVPESLLGILTIRINPQAHRYRRSFHP